MRNFGSWLRENRKRSGLTQGELGRKAGISTSYVSTLERSEPHHLTNALPQPTPDVVESLARAMQVPIDEARIQAGYAPVHMIMVTQKPQTLPELIDALSNLGVDGIQFFDQDRLRDAPPEEIEKVFDAVRIAIELTLNKYKPDASHTRTETLHG